MTRSPKTLPIAAIIVRWKGGDEVHRCLGSLTSDSGSRPEETVLVDSGSGDGGAEHLAAAFPQIRVIALAENRGFAAAANVGATASRAPHLLLLNPDTEVNGPALEALFDEHQRHQKTAGSVPMLVGRDGASQWRWQLRRLPTVNDLSFGRGGKPAFRSAPSHPVDVAQPAAAAWLVRRPVWERLGGLDEGFRPAWWEDVDFCARLGQQVGRGDYPATRGFTVVPSSEVLHLGGSSVAALGRGPFLRAYYGNMLRYASLHHSSRINRITRVLRLWLGFRMVIDREKREDLRTVLKALP